MEQITEKQKVEQDLEWVDATILRLRRTRDYRDIKQSLIILDKRKQSLIQKLQDMVDLD